MSYFSELEKSMSWLGEKPDTIFIGQSVRYKGNAIFNSLSGVPMEKRTELPIIEDCQLGMSIGLAMMGKSVISIYPRMDFLLCAMNQLCNHLDKNIYPMKGQVIIRTCVGSTKPLYPGVQHCGDYTSGLRKMLKNVRVYDFTSSQEILPCYQEVYKGKENAVMVEQGDLYGVE